MKNSGIYYYYSRSLVKRSQMAAGSGVPFLFMTDSGGMPAKVLGYMFLRTSSSPSLPDVQQFLVANVLIQFHGCHALDKIDGVESVSYWEQAYQCMNPRWLVLSSGFTVLPQLGHADALRYTSLMIELWHTINQHALLLR